ncbi:uncharacterized protein LOC124353367 isoform X1 [Homalodisca vitripennis]|uniref:uncharacterized protein LOC124353367 isoform X1 n=2 Tax=Homalodisca vitripennis TaxID=197043 RepID=UPI001EEB2BBD|nr:uncharacterized protein LOC124353367 isoform X1 [Homalodisca vitripennis]
MIPESIEVFIGPRKLMIFDLCATVIAASWISGIFAVEWGQPHVKYSTTDGYFPIPEAVSEISCMSNTPEYIFMCHDDVLNVDLYSYPDDPRVILLFDKCDNISGIRYCVIKSDVARRAEYYGLAFNYSYDDKGAYQNHTYWGIDVWCTDVLFASPGTLSEGCRCIEEGTVPQDIYVVLENYEYTKITRYESEVENQGFTKQGCYPGMGQHYFYKMYIDGSCDDHVGIAVIYDQGYLIGVVHGPFGTFTSKKRVWFEDPTPEGMKAVAPYAPQCFYQLGRYYGFVSFHIFINKNPWETTCPV